MASEGTENRPFFFFTKMYQSFNEKKTPISKVLVLKIEEVTKNKFLL